MTRKKVKLGWISNDSARKASLKKRRVGLLKKVSELCILCDVVACAIVYSPNEAEPVFFPPTRSDVEAILHRFEQVPEMEKNRKTMNQESYLKERAAKHQDQLRKNLKKNREMQMNHFLHQMYRAAKPYTEFAHTQLHGLRYYVEEKWRECRRRMQFFHQATGEPLPPAPAHMPGGDEEMEQVREHDLPQWEHWFANMMQNEPNVLIGRNIPGGNAPTGNVPDGDISGERHVPSNIHLNKGKAILRAYDGNSSHGDEMAELQEPLGGSTQENQAAPSPVNVRGESGVRNLGMPQGQAEDDGQGMLVPYGAPGATGGSSECGTHQGNLEAIGFGGMLFARKEAGGSISGHGLGTHHNYLLPHQEIGGSNYIYSMTSSLDENVTGSESGHATIPFPGGTRGRGQGSRWTQQNWNVEASNTGYNPVILNPFRDDGGSSGGYAMQQYNWNVGGSGSGHGITPTHGHEAGSNIYGITSQQQNLGSAYNGFGMMLSQGHDGSSIGGYDMMLSREQGGSSGFHMMLHQGQGGSRTGGFDMMLPQGQGGSNSGAFDMMLPQGHGVSNAGAFEMTFPQDQGGSNTDGFGVMLSQGYSGSGIGGFEMMFAQGNGGSNAGGFFTMPPQGDVGSNPGGFSMALSQGEDGGNTGGFGTLLHQGQDGYAIELQQENAGGRSNEQQENMLAPEDGGGYNFPAGMALGDPVNNEEPTDPWGPYYNAGSSSGAGNVAQQAGEEKDRQNYSP